MTTTPPETEPEPKAEPEPESKAEPKAEPKAKAKRYCVYDTTYLRFVGPVLDSKPSASKMREIAAEHGGEVDGDALEAREV
jgi:hypothetical protein